MGKAANGAELNSTLTVGKGSAATLNATGRAIAGVGNVLASSATNKLLDEPSGFSWTNVAASAVGSALGSPIVGESGSGNFIMDVGNSILGTAAGYATKKIVNNEGSWNNQNVLVDAFGNAIGNSIASSMMQRPEPRFKGSVDTSKLDAKLAKKFGSEFNAATDKQVSDIAEQKATNLSDTVTILLANEGSGSFYAAEEAAAAYRSGAVLQNFYDSSVGAYNDTVGYLNNVYKQGDEARQHNAEMSAYRNQRYSVGNAAAAAEFDAIGVSGVRVDLNDDAMRAAWALNQKDAFAEVVRTGVVVTAAAALPFTLSAAGIGATITGLVGRSVMPLGFGGTYALNGSVSAGINGVFDSYNSDLDTHSIIRNAALNFTLGGVVGTAAVPGSTVIAGSFIRNPYGQQLAGNVIGNTLVDTGYQLATAGEINLGRLAGVAATSGLGFASGELLGNAISKTRFGSLNQSHVDNYFDKFTTSFNLDDAADSLSNIIGNSGREFTRNLIPKGVSLGKTIVSGNVGGFFFNGTANILDSTSSVIDRNQALNPEFRLFEPGKL
ncbi:hypothetical protein OPS25_07185 [Alteromonas ponticola]|uniref:DUF637 domain-containing protein n=1 Tax=Alteromonas aquimaris TaxID=2998417 RepID=A0ABT3P6A0_9ALTE|nr:hypothetical protein [Alteromonas aquimaris]MCW8108275.1 hypothetical protein [Alteromonas aquimaris]